MILVTGAAGFIGSHFLNLLYKNGEENLLVVDDLTYAANLNYIKNVPHIFLKGDISDEQFIKSIFEKYKKEITSIINFAAESHVDRSIDNCMPFVKTNIIGTVNLLNYSRSLPNLSKFIQISTDEVFGQLKENDESFNETSRLSPRNPYSASKTSAEHFINAFFETFQIPTIIVNSSNNYGPHQYPEKLIPATIKRALKNDPVLVYGEGRQIRDWIYVTDNCKAILTIFRTGTLGERYCIGGGFEYSNLQVVKKILKILNKPESLIKMISDRPGHDFRYSTNIDKIKNLGWEPTIDFDNGLEQTIDWYLKNEV